MKAGAALASIMFVTAATASAAEPSTRMTLEIDGTTVDVVAGQRFDVLVDGKQRPARITQLPTLQFDEAGIRFHYPRHMSWEHDPPDLWTLDGNNAVLILTRGHPGDDSSAEDVLDGMADNLGKRSGAYRKIVLDTRQGHIDGLEAVVEVGTVHIRIEAYALKNDDRSALLILQDSSDGDAADVAEFRDLRKQLATSLEF